MTCSGGGLEESKEKSEGLRKAAELRVQKVEEELATLKSPLQSQVDATDQKGYDDGYDKATTEYKAHVKEMVADVYSTRFKAGVKWYHDHLMVTLNPSEGLYIRTLFEPPVEQLVMPNPDVEEQGAQPNDKPKGKTASKTVEAPSS